MDTIISALSLLFLITFCGGITEEDEGVKYANLCEGTGFFLFKLIFYIRTKLANYVNYYYLILVCKVLATELQGRLEETGKTRDVIEIGYSLDDVKPKKKFKYEKS